MDDHNFFFKILGAITDFSHEDDAVAASTNIDANSFIRDKIVNNFTRIELEVHKSHANNDVALTRVTVYKLLSDKAFWSFLLWFSEVISQIAPKGINFKQ